MKYCYSCIGSIVSIILFVFLHRKTGMAHFYPKGSEKLDKVVANMHNCNLPVSLLDAKQAKDSCPYLNMPDDFMAAVEEEAGILAASKAVRALQVIATRVGVLRYYVV